MRRFTDEEGVVAMDGWAKASLTLVVLTGTHKPHLGYSSHSKACLLSLKPDLRKSFACTPTCYEGPSHQEGTLPFTEQHKKANTEV